MGDPSLSRMHRLAASNLEDALRHFNAGPTGPAAEFVELKLQACMFQYDVCAEMIAFLRNKPRGFAASVSLKGLVLNLFEYDRTLNKTFIPRLIALAAARGVPFDKMDVKEARRAWKEEMKNLRKWSTVRDHAAAHYDGNVKRQITVLRSLDALEVMDVAKAFLSFNMALLVGLAEVGRGVRR